MQSQLFQKKVWLSILGTIILGAIGSGLWSLVEAPLGTAGNWLLSLVTLGIGSVRDGLYADAAKGLHELPSLLLFVMASAFLFLAPAMVAAEPLLRSRIRKLIEKEDPAQNEREKVLKRAARSFWINALLGTAAGSFFLIQALFAEQQNLIVTSFTQRMKIVAPFITTVEHVQYDSAFARMQSRPEYIALMQKLDAIGKANKVFVPEVSTW